MRTAGRSTGTHVSDHGGPAAGETERARIERVYGSYQASGRTSERWDDQRPGNRCMLEERSVVTRQVLRTRPSPLQILEVGCGAGTVLREIQDILGSGTPVHGVDLLFDRLGSSAGDGRFPVQADGRQLPYQDGQFDLVIVHTVFSSILDPATRGALANELRRVLAQDGAILWYDLRYPSTNRAVRPVTTAQLRALFPDMTRNVQTVTLLPPLARRLGARDSVLYPWLRRVPVLRSHLIGLITPADSVEVGTQ